MSNTLLVFGYIKELSMQLIIPIEIKKVLILYFGYYELIGSKLLTLTEKDLLVNFIKQQTQSNWN